MQIVKLLRHWPAREAPWGDERGGADEIKGAPSDQAKQLGVLRQSPVGRLVAEFFVDSDRGRLPDR